MSKTDKDTAAIWAQIERVFERLTALDKEDADFWKGYAATLNDIEGRLAALEAAQACPTPETTIEKIVNNIDWSTRKIQIDRTPTALDSLTDHVQSSYFGKPAEPTPAKPSETVLTSNLPPGVVVNKDGNLIFPIKYKDRVKLVNGNYFFDGVQITNNKPTDPMVKLAKVKKFKNWLNGEIARESDKSEAIGLMRANYAFKQFFEEELASESEGESK